MSGQFEHQELQKAAQNLQKVKLFLDCRLSWWVEAEARSHLNGLMTSAAELTGSIGNILQSNNLGFPPKFRDPDREQLAPAGIEAANLAKLAGFLSQMNLWFKARQDWQVDKASAETVRGMFSALRGLTGAAKAVLTTPSPDGSNPPPEPVAPPRPVRSEPPAMKRREGASVSTDPDATRLELADDPENPLVASVRGIQELSPEAKELVDNYLEANGFELVGHELRRYHDKVLRWIAATPEGQVLVLRIGTLRGEPYPSYQPKPEPPDEYA